MSVKTFASSAKNTYSEFLYRFSKFWFLAAKDRITLVNILTAVCLCREHFNRSGLNSKLRAIQTVSVLLQGPSEVGNRTLEMSGMMDAVISLCASEDVIHQQVAVEALIHATSKAKRASFITANGVALLKDLYKKSENDRIRVRALVVSDAARVNY